MGTDTVEWELGFAGEEVVRGVENLCLLADYRFRRERSADEGRFHIPIGGGGGCVVLEVCPLAPRSLSAAISFPRTRLRIRFHDAEGEARTAFMRRLTLAFLRVGG